MVSKMALSAFVMACASFSGFLFAEEAKPFTASQINPLTGKPLSFEEKQRELETAKLDSAILDERFKQEQVRTSLEMIPVHKRVELKKLDMEANKALEPKLPDRQTPLSLAKPKVQKGVKTLETPKSVAVASAPAPAVYKGMRVTAILRMNGKGAAVVEHNGVSDFINEGETVNGLRVEEVNKLGAKINGTYYWLATDGISVIPNVDKQAIASDTSTPAVSVMQAVPLPTRPLAPSALVGR